MPRHLFRHLRRSHTLMVLAVCAWLALASVAWAMPHHDDCCPSGASPMAMQHVSPEQSAAHASTLTPDSCCTHAPASVPDAMVPHVLHVQTQGSLGQARNESAPQPAHEPPLRPPVA